MMQQYFNSQAVSNYRSLQFEQAVKLLDNLLTSPRDFAMLIHKYVFEYTMPSFPYVYSSR